MNVIEEPNEQEVYNYSKIIRPTSMRSTYWKFFGFPADDSGSIITRRSVICSICGFTLSYNKNTSNLKSHLRSKHPEQMNFTYNPPTKKTKFIYAPTNDIGNEMKQVYSIKQQPSEIIGNPDDLIEILAEDVDADDYQEVNDDYQIEYLTSDDVNNFDEETAVLKAVTSNVKSMKRKHSETDHFAKSSVNVESFIVSMIIDDLLPTTISEGSGFINLVTSLCGSRVQVPNSKSIEKHIQQMYNTDYNRLSQSIKTEIEVSYFSIGFEKWGNKEDMTFITTHVNYLADDDQLNSVVLNVVDSSYASDWKRHFSMLKMENCTAAIVDFNIDDEDALKLFLESYSKKNVEQKNDIPVIPCLLTTISKAASKCFASAKAEDIYERAVNVFNEHSRFVPDVAEPPKINKNFWVTKLNFFEFISDFLTNNSERIEMDISQLLEDIKTVVECLTPLKLTQDTVCMEQLALASLIRPLTSQLLNSHYTLDEGGSVLENDLIAIIHKTLKDTQSSSSKFLMQASFLDPRFQSLQIAEDVAVIKSALKKLNRIDPADTTEMLGVKKEKDQPMPSIQKQKSVGLKFFFGNKEQKTTPNKSIDRFDVEFNNYNANADANLDQQVLSWWKDSALIYPNLKKIANRFNCVLLSVQKCETNLQKQILFYDKRAMCTGNSVDCLLWLHQNRNN